MPTVIDRYARQQNIVPRDSLNHLVTVVGCGAIGRHVAMNLAAMGVQAIKLIDFDIVETHNCTTQGWSERHIGYTKVEALRDSCRQINVVVPVEIVADRFRKKFAGSMGRAVFCCVDNMDIRKLVWESVKGKIDFYCDGRMLGEYMRILAIGSEKDEEFYESTLHPESETIQGTCTSEGVIYTAGIAAGMMAHQYTRWLRGYPVLRETMLHLPAGEMKIVEGEGSRHTMVTPVNPVAIQPPAVPVSSDEDEEDPFDDPYDDDVDDDDDDDDEDTEEQENDGPF